MLHRAAGTPGLQVRRLQLEVPLGGPVGVVHQHQGGAVAQADRLLFHRQAVLFDEHAPEEAQQRHGERKPREDVPRGHDVNAAEVALDGRDGGAAREPLVSGANLLETHVGQDKFDRGGGLAVGLEQLVGSAVGRGRVGLNAKAVGDGLEGLFLYLDAAAAAPPPGLVHKGAVGGVHQSDDAVVHVRGQIGGEVGNAVTLAEDRQARHRRRRGDARGGVG